MQPPVQNTITVGVAARTQNDGTSESGRLSLIHINLSRSNRSVFTGANTCNISLPASGLPRQSSHLTHRNPGPFFTTSNQRRHCVCSIDRCDSSHIYSSQYRFATIASIRLWWLCRRQCFSFKRGCRQPRTGLTITDYGRHCRLPSAALNRTVTEPMRAPNFPFEPRV